MQGLNYREGEGLFDPHLGQIVCVWWCIVLLEMPLTRFEECWPLLTESLPELPYNLNMVTLTLTLWLINSGVLTSLLLPHLLQTPCLPWISYATQKLMLDACKIVQKQSEGLHTFLWVFFPSLKHNFIAYRSSRPDCNFENHQLWQSGFSRVCSNCCCSCSFEPKIIIINQSSHKIYSNKIQNFQESTAILNACTKKKKILETYWIHHVHISTVIFLPFLMLSAKIRLISLIFHGVYLFMWTQFWTTKS